MNTAALNGEKILLVRDILANNNVALLNEIKSLKIKYGIWLFAVRVADGHRIRPCKALWHTQSAKPFPSPGFPCLLRPVRFPIR